MTLWFKSRIFLAAGLIFAADRLTKYFIIKSLALGQSIRVIPDIFHITLVFNNGAAFGVLQNCALFFIIFSFAAIALILLIIFRAHQMDALLAVSLALILGGAAGNLVDRIKFGYVIDFLDFRVWPVFNIADSCISIGIALIAFSFIFKRSG
jgi:signal peptidase II